MAQPERSLWRRREAPGSAPATPPAARGRKAEGAAPSPTSEPIWPPPHVGVPEGDQGGRLVRNELRGPHTTAPTPVCGTAPPKPRLWIYEKEALVPQPESGLALFSSLEGVRTWFGGKVFQRFSISHPRFWAS